MCDLCEGDKIGYIELGIADRLGKQGSGLWCDGFSERFRIAGIDKGHLAAQLRHGVVKKLIRAAIKVVGGDNLIANLRDIEDSKCCCCLAGSNSQRARPAFESGNALFEDIRRRIHDPRVDIAKLFQGEQIRRMFRVLEHIGSGLVNRDSARAGGWVGDLAGMQG